MPLKEFIEEVKTLVSTAQEQKALEKSIQFFSADKKYAFYEKTTRALHGRLQDLNKYSRLNLLTFGEITRTKGKIHLRILDLLQDLEDGKIQRDDPKQVNAPAPRWAGVIGTYLSAIVGFITLIFNFNAEKKVSEKDFCPPFEQDVYAILVFPFNAIENSGEFKPELAIGKRLNDYLRDSLKDNQATQATSVETYKNAISYHGNDQSVIELGQQCSAKMVIWGEFINTPQKKIIYPHFAFTDQTIYASGIMAEDDAFTITGLNDIIDGSLVTKNMEDGLFKLFGLVVQLSQNISSNDLVNSADELLAITSDTASKLIALAVRSKALYQLGDTALAEKSLQEMVKLESSNNYALINLGNIHVNQGNYNQAVEEYSKVIENDPDKTSVKIKRADVLTKMDRAADAKKELEQIKAEQKNVDTVFINKKIIQNEAIIKAKTNTTVSGLTPTQKSTLNLSIGNFDAAQTEAAKAIKNSPQNNTAKNNFIEAVLSKPVNETKKIEELNNMNITQNDIQKALNANAFLKYKVDSTQLQKIVKRKN